MANTEEVENFPGFEMITGQIYLQKCLNTLKSLVQFINMEILNL